MKAIQYLFTLYCIIIFFLLLIALGLLIVIPVIIHPKGGEISFFFIRIWARTWSFLCGIRYKFHGKEYLDLNQSYIYIFNHRSFIDAPIIPLAIPQQIRAIGKKELSRIPLFGWVAGKVAIWVDRTDAESRKISVERLSEFLKLGISVVVSPEGTRNNTEDPLLPFQKGAFRLAIETKTPIAPIAIIGADQIMKRGSWLISPGKVNVYFSKPIPAPQSSHTAVSDYIELCREKLVTMILAHKQL